MKRMLLVIMSLQLMVSCSGTKKKNEDDKMETIDDEVVLIEEDELDGELDEDVAMEESGKESSSDEQMVAETEVSTIPSDGKMGEYITQKNDTLMIIAWKMYGDYTKWRNLLEWNSDKISSVSGLKVGTRIKYMYPDSPFNWQPSGEAYLIRRGDTLTKISSNVYNTHKLWRKIYNNNRPLIRDPNLIFAGFTLYYEELDRNTASDQ